MDSTASVIDQSHLDEDWHDQLLQLNTDVAMDFVKQNLEINNMESYCNAKEELLNELKLEVTSLQGEVNLKVQELNHLQEKEELLTNELNILNEMIDSKESTEDILLENQRLLKAKQERHKKEWKAISDNYNDYMKQLRENFEKKPLAAKRLNLLNKVQMQRINLAVIRQKVQDQTENLKMLRDIRKRQEQIKIIKFAQVMVEYKEMQKMQDEIKMYERKFQEITENRRMEFVPKDDIFKVPQVKPISQNKINTTFQLPTLNLSAYQIHPQSFVPNKTMNEGIKSKYSLNEQMDKILSKLNMNKRNQSFSPQMQKKQKTWNNLSRSLPLKQNVTQIQNQNQNQNENEKQKKRESFSFPENLKNDSSVNEDIFEYTSQNEQHTQNVDAGTTQTIPLKSPYFPAASISISSSTDHHTSQIISSGASTSSHVEKSNLEVSDYNEHDVDIMETSSFLSMEEFKSPPGPSSDVENIPEQQPQEMFFSKMFGGAASASTSQNTNTNPGFSFLNTPSRKKSSQNIFSMF